MMISYAKWLERNFDPVPPISTARKWIAAKLVYPLPRKVGRTYYVDENAVYGASVKPRLVDRIPKAA